MTNTEKKLCEIICAAKYTENIEICTRPCLQISWGIDLIKSEIKQFADEVLFEDKKNDLVFDIEQLLKDRGINND